MSEPGFEQPYGWKKEQKQPWLLEQLRELNDHHERNCEPYANMLRKAGAFGDGGIGNWPEPAEDPNGAGRASGCGAIEELPMLPVPLFKMAELRSVPPEHVFKTLTSSGTTSQGVSKIFLDRETATMQTKALAAIVTSFLGKRRRPMIVVDHKNVLRDRKSFSARGAGIVGFSTFGKDPLYLLREDGAIDEEGLAAFMERHRGEPVFLFGFTYMVWKHLIRPLEESGRTLELGGGILIHGGGWKKMQEEAVGNDRFKQAARERLGIGQVYNYYGMVEQVGSIYMECEQGHLHAPAFADIRIRDPLTLELLPAGQQGVIQTLSVLPRSYPGHNLLTEDLGVLLGEDDCPCGRYGKYFVVEGRLPRAELRGCSDTAAYGAGVSG